MEDNCKKAMRARPLMVQGTASHAGKTIITAALCRILRGMGLSVAPFKAQNMALNSFVTRTGGEIGVAQALQARAAGIEPTVDMNPLLLKPTGEADCQVIVHGRVYGAMSARGYHGFKKEAMGFVMESYERLAAAYDVVVIEGAGSPAEINLRKNDIANMGIALRTGSPVLLVGDIDRGGVFASIVGTMELLAPEERALVKAFIINKFRGDESLLLPGLEFLEKKTGVPAMGVVPFVESMGLPDEDGVALERAKGMGRGRADEGACGMKRPRIAVIRLPRISNFTDFDPLRHEGAVDLEFVDEPSRMEGASLVIIPGSKNTQADLRWLRERGFEEALRACRRGGGLIMGICGGFQMLGRVIEDPLGVESGHGRTEGLGFLDVTTRLEAEKATFNVVAEALAGLFGCAVGERGEGETGVPKGGEAVERGVPKERGMPKERGVPKMSGLPEETVVPKETLEPDESGGLEVTGEPEEREVTVKPEGREGSQVPGAPVRMGPLVKGFEIHAGSSTGAKRPLFRIRKRNGRDADILDGAVSADGAVAGTYLHGLFHNDGLRRALVHELCRRAGAEPAEDGEAACAANYEAVLEERIDALAAAVRGALDMDMLLGILGITGARVRSGPGPGAEGESTGMAKRSRGAEMRCADGAERSRGFDEGAGMGGRSAARPSRREP